MNSSSKPHVRIYDTTLRDGEQQPGIAFSRAKRIEIAQALDRLGVDDIELGFAASGKAQQRDMAATVRSGLRALTFSLARPLARDIDAAVEAGVQGVNIFIGASDIHLEHKLRTTFPEIVDKIEKATALACSANLYVSIALEDATRTPDDRLATVARVGEAAGAKRISLADTVGTATPEVMTRSVKAVMRACGMIVTAHCHNDFGLAVANALAAVEAGARCLSVTVNGFGERAGNAALEECAVALEFLYGYETSLDLRRLVEVSRLVEKCSRVRMQPNKAVVGSNSFRHESGIHVAAILRNPQTYEPYDPSLVGQHRQIVLGKTAGRAAIRHLAGEAADDLSDDEVNYILDRVKELAESGECERPGVLEELISECKKNRHQTPLRKESSGRG